MKPSGRAKDKLRAIPGIAFDDPAFRFVSMRAIC
jgi:hypothetical protein